MSELTVKIKGINFCGQTSTEIQVIFPCSLGHELKITRAVIGGQVAPRVTLSGKNVLEIILENNAAFIQPDPPDNELINIAPWRNLTGSNLKLMTRNSDPASMQLSFLKIPGTPIFSVDRVSENKDEIFKESARVEAQVKFDIPTGSVVKLIVNNDQVNPLETFNDEPGKNYLLTFDNHYENATDFGKYYELFLESIDEKGVL